MSSAAILISLIGALQSLSCEGGGGPSAFGYDASSVCSKPYNMRSSRAFLENLPCDFSKQSWCNVPGDHYPWRAMRRFVQENQGLMRRMYGIERQIDILKAEFDKKDIELDYDDDQYMDEPRQYRDDDTLEYNYDDDALLGRRYMNRNAGSRSRKLQIKPKGRRKSKLLEGFESTASSTTPTSTSSSTLSSTSSPTLSTTSSTTSATTMKTTPLTTTTTELDGTNLTSTTVASTTSVNVETTTSFEKNSTTDLDEETEKPATTMRYMETSDGEEDEFNGTTMSTIADRINENFSINEIPGQNDRLDTNIDELTEIPEDEELDSAEDLLLKSGFIDEAATPSNLNNESSQTTKKPLLEAQQFRPRPEYSEKKPTSEKPDNSDTQHYHQDLENKNPNRESVLKIRGVNACPVKDEVVAPYWANNTRGELLALVNHHPFEQYVHWEKCTHENKQMYCREGCRCEQQYRLHRLLAYDPFNGCRGIFSDWFEFPSCCVCRCYDLPLEFRVTSRSPRVLKRKVKIRRPRY